MSKSQESTPANATENSDTVSMNAKIINVHEDELSTLKDLTVDVHQMYLENWEPIQIHFTVKKSLITYTSFHPFNQLNSQTDWEL